MKNQLNHNLNEKIALLQLFFNDAKKIVFFSGAGISTESGIPDFRGPNGLYSQTYDNKRPEEILSHNNYIHHPELYFKFFFEKKVFLDAKPNQAHLAIAKWQETKDIKVVTQNVDNLHQLAGSKTVYELHGSNYRMYCWKNHHQYNLLDVIKMKGDAIIPICPEDGSNIRPDVILFGEPLKQDVLENAVKAINEADLIIVGGTSLLVYPAAGLINYMNPKAKLVIINYQPENIICDLQINAKLGDVLSLIK